MRTNVSLFSHRVHVVMLKQTKDEKKKEYMYI